MNFKKSIMALFFIGGFIPQVFSSEEIGLSIRGGFFIPTHSGPSPANGSRNIQTVSMFGAEYQLSSLGKTRGNQAYNYLTASIDYFDKRGRSNIPILLNVVARNGRIYGSAGAGIGFGRIGEKGRKSNMTYQGSIGLDLPIGKAPFFTEIRYLGVLGENNASELNGFSVLGGFRL